ncbi:nucleotide sugar dehydrogenase [Marinimicrococcus flavescens]|uniref:UDP-glucose 6-dehydrogenase n=1 Tax=Marinimicrococcus flavescens TaxID=3031815 RepID=A0AAP3UZ19_9PROT|nr:nucleotide sugar dehydrogenase [Marinimicrococcus flavescens]
MAEPGKEARRTLGIAVLGLGHVGAAMAACLLEAGHRVLAVDPDATRAARVARGQAPVHEPGVAERLARGLAAGRLAVAGRLEELAGLDLVLVCVGTPPHAGGGLALGEVETASRTLGRLLRRRAPDLPPLLLAYRSTLPPGTMEETVLPLLETESGAPPGSSWEAVYHPEFLREGSAVADQLAPSRIVLGERRPGAGRRLEGLHDGLDAPLFETSFAEAETLKLVDNGFHALKVAFANEIGRLCVAGGVDPQAVMRLLLADRRLNLSAAYLRPGAPFGGACLPKDLGSLLALGQTRGLELPLMAGVLASNDAHLAWLEGRVRALLPPPGPLLLLGLSFKPGTDDLRASPLVRLAGRLLAAGYRLDILDPDLDPEGAPERAAGLAAPLRACLRADLEAAAGPWRLALIGKPLPALVDRLPADLPRLDLHRLGGTAGA